MRYHLITNKKTKEVKIMNSLTEQKLYLEAKADLFKAEESFLKLTPEQKQRLIIEMFGYELLMEAVKFAERRK